MPDYLENLGLPIFMVGLSNAKTRAQQFMHIGSTTGINLAMEIGQYFGTIPGTYYTNDILAFVGGAITAGVIVKLTTKKEGLENKVLEPDKSSLLTKC